MLGKSASLLCRKQAEPQGDRGWGEKASVSLSDTHDNHLNQILSAPVCEIKWSTQDHRNWFSITHLP